MIEITGLGANAWHDIYAATDIAVGTPLLVYNKSTSTIYIWEGASGPISSSMGVPVDVDCPTVISEGSPGAWVRSIIPVSINVQGIE